MHIAMKKICIIQTGMSSSAELTALCAEIMPAVGVSQIIDAITPHGRTMAKWPCHPRIAQMLQQGPTPKLKALAAYILNNQNATLADSDDVDEMQMLLPHCVTTRICLRLKDRAAKIVAFIRMKIKK